MLNLSPSPFAQAKDVRCDGVCGGGQGGHRGDERQGGAGQLECGH